MTSAQMILCVRTDLGMGRGKIAAQCCHAAVGVYSEMINSNNDYYTALLSAWEDNGQAKICVRVDSEEQLENILEIADNLSIPTYVVHDAGHTQVAPNTLTVAAIGPANASLIDQVTGNLKLLG
jgi:peptidyl-tRNA hydrolase